MTRRFLLLGAVAMAALAGPSSAAAVTQLGTPPWKECGGLFQGGVSGCVASEPQAMDDTSVGNVNISPHVIRVGETLTISAEWLPGWAITGFGSLPGTVISGCGLGEHSCTVKIDGPTGGYVRKQLDFCCFNAREQDYYAVIGGDEYIIEGTVMDRFGPRQELRPAAFTEVTATIGGDSYSVTTNKMGQYEMLVEAGSGSIRTAGKQCVKADLPKCNTSKQLTVGPNQHVDFEAPPPGKIKGTVKDEEGNPEAGVTIRADDPEGGRLDTSVSDESGHYELTARAGDVHLSADDPQACAVGAGEECPKTKDIELASDQTATLDWKVEGCVKKVDFGSSMVAVRGCFTKVEDEKWETDEKFTMNGLDLYPSGKVTLDKQARRVSFGGGEAKLGNDAKVRIPSFDLDFPSAETKYELTALDSKGKTVQGFDVADKLDLKFEAGKTTVVMNTKTDTGFGKEYPEQKCKGKAATVLSLTQTNDDGFRSASFEAKDLQQVFCLPGMGRAAGVLTVDSVKGSFDFKTHWWSVGGSFAGLKPFSAKFSGSKLSAEFFVNNRLQLKGGSLSINGLNVLLEPPLLHLQRLGIKFGQTNEGEPFKSEASLGVSVGPKFPGGAKELNIPLLGKFVVYPEELTALDLTFGGSISEGDHPASLEDLTLSGNGKVKFWDQQILDGTAKLIIPSASFAFSGALDFKAGNVFALHGDGKSWVDTVNGVFFAEGFGQMNVLGWRAMQGNFLLNSSTPIAVGCVRSSSGREFGVTYNFKAEAPKIAGCDLGPYRATPPKGARIASVSKAGGAKSFTVPKGTSMLALEVKGNGPSGAPVVKLSGPSGAFLTEPVKPSEGKFVRALPNGAEGATYLLLSSPKAGRWKVAAQAGSSVSGLGFARPAPEPVVSGSSSGDTCAPTLRWSLKRQPGQAVMLVDEGAAGDTRILSKAAKAKGSLKLVPPAPGIRRVRALVFQGGGLRESIPLSSYGGPGAPSGLKVKRAKKGLILSWRASCGVSSYSVKIGKGKPKLIKGNSVTIDSVPKKAMVSITSLVDGNAVGTATRPLAPGTP